MSQRHQHTGFYYYYDRPAALRPDTYYCGDSFELLQRVEPATADMVLIDPPYFMEKDKEWDSFGGKADYLNFMGKPFREAERLLKPNGTLAFWHNDLHKISWLCEWLEENTALRFATWGIWIKQNHRTKLWKNPGAGNTLRSWFNIGEFCIFFVKTTPGTAWNKTGRELVYLDTTKFAPLRDYFHRLQAFTGATKRQIMEACGQAADHCFRWNSTQWLLPTRETYMRITAAFDCCSWPEYRTFDSLTAEHAALVAEYEAEIQEINAARFVHNLDANHCNVWTTTEPQGGQKLHKCQKPVDITERIIRTHTNPGALVVDFFAGSGSTGVAALKTGRRFLLIDQNPKYQAAGAAWIEQKKPFAFDCKGQKKKHGHGNGRTSIGAWERSIGIIPQLWHLVNVLPEGGVTGLYGVIKTEQSQLTGGSHMRTTKRERRYICGMNKQEAKYQEVEIYTVGTDKAGRAREKEKSTPPPLWGKKPEKWDGHNAARARKWFARVLATNFTEQDIHLTTTYNPEMLPDNDTQADRDITNLLRHLREKCRKQGLPDPQAIIVTENQEANPETGQKAVRYHHHIILRCALTRDEIEACWHRKGKRLGLANADRLQMDKHHLNALAGYLMKYPKRRHRWRRTKGIQDPILPKPNDSKYTRRGIERIAKDPAKLNDPKFWAKKYPGWELVEATATYNDYWGWSIMLKMHKVQERGRGRPRGDQD